MHSRAQEIPEKNARFVEIVNKHPVLFARVEKKAGSSSHKFKKIHPLHHLIITRFL